MLRRSGAFSQRDIIGCERRFRPLSGSRPQAIAKMRARRMSANGCVTRLASRPSGITAASLAATPSRCSASASSITPPPEVIRPPSNAAVTFLRPTAGNVNGRDVSSVMADVGGPDVAEGLA